MVDFTMALNGLVSGCLALLGVWITLTVQKQNKKKDNFADQVANLLEVHLLTSQLYSEFNGLEDNSRDNVEAVEKKERKIFDLLVDIYKKSAKVDSHIFIRVHQFEENVRQWVNMIYVQRRQNNKKNASELIVQVKNETENLMSFINEHRDKLAASYRKFSK